LKKSTTGDAFTFDFQACPSVTFIKIAPVIVSWLFSVFISFFWYSPLSSLGDANCPNRLSRDPRFTGMANRERNSIQEQTWEDRLIAMIELGFEPEPAEKKRAEGVRQRNAAVGSVGVKKRVCDSRTRMREAA
jgi:hypothetical protein